MQGHEVNRTVCRVTCRRWRVNVIAIGGWLVIALSLTVGCDSGSDPSQTASQQDEKEFANPAGSLKIAARRGQWDEAWRAGDALLAEAEENGIIGEIDSDTLMLAAQAAHETGRAAKSAEILEQACINESYINPARLHQTIIAMVAVGRFYETFDVLENALQVQPNQHETRRWLFDFYIGSDDRVSANPHGQQLVRDRQFDLTMLKDLSNTERRTLDAKPLDQMVSRNPDDKRPLLGKAKRKFDEAKYQEAIDLLQQIVVQHPGHQPSQALLGQSFSAARRFKDVEDWAAKQSAGIQSYPGYWIAIGDWARAQGDLHGALRAFIEAANSGDPDVVQIWTRLATLLPEWSGSKVPVPNELIEIVNQRAQELGKFHQLKDRFKRTGEISRDIALQIAQSLVDLGRLWEAEAWAAIATTLPDDESVDLDGFRAQLVGKLKPETPWRSVGGSDAFDNLRDQLPLPSIERVVAGSVSKTAGDSRSVLSKQSDHPVEKQSADWAFKNEAGQRGLDFWGRTGDKLDQPGIMLYQTLGCGGGTIDFDLDGWSDLYLVAAGGTPPRDDSAANALFRNQDGFFQRVDGHAGVGDTGFGQGVAVGDVNEDGFPDVLVLNYGRNRLFINRGDGTFGDASELISENESQEWSSSGAIADVDGDALADIVIVNYCATLDPVTQSCPMKDSDLIRSCSPMLFSAEPDQFFRSQGDGQFHNVTDAWEANSDSSGRGLGIVVGDLDGKQGNEVFIANDMTNNHYWSKVASQPSNSQPEFRLVESAMLRGIGADDRGIPQGSMGIASADLDRDGDLDFYVTNFDKEYNTLHSQTSPGIWQDRTQTYGLVADARPLVAFGTEAIDVDNDGQLELVVTNGHVDLFSRGDEKALYEQPLQIFRRGDDQKYVSVSMRDLGGYCAEPHVGRGLWTIDIDRDGRQDFVVTHQTEPTALVVNQTAEVGRWIRLVLKGRNASRDAIGSTVRVSSSSGSFTAFQLAGDGYQCSNDRALQLGLGKIPNDVVDVSVRWPNGKSETFTDVPTQQESILVEGLSQ